MFTGITNILSPKEQRRAEETDTRQALQRHDPDFERNRKKKQKPKEPSFEDGVAATLSVEALQTFLKTLLESKTTENIQSADTAAPTPETEAKTERPQHTTAPDHHVSASAARAAGAYQNTTQNARKRDNVLLETTDTAIQGPEFDLSAADIRAIHALMDDLKTLSNAGIDVIQIERAESFLKSLQNAVASARLKIN